MRRRVDDAGLLGRGDALEETTAFHVLVGEGLDAEPQIGAVEPAHDDAWVAHTQALHDLLAHGRRGRGRERQHRGLAQFLDDGAQPQVVGAEVVAPLADAVRLVDDEQRWCGLPQALQRFVVRELLRCERQEFEPLRLQILEGLLALTLAQRRVHHGRLPDVVRVDRFDLIALQGDERRDDHGRAGQQQAGDLVDGRFARSRRHHGERVALLQEGADGLFLAGMERLVAKALAGNLAQRSAMC